MNINPEMLAAAYEYFRVSEPFCDFALPHADVVEFRVVNDRRRYGWHERPSHGTNIIAVSQRNVCHTANIMWVVAHEMIHLYQAESGTSTKANHNAEFNDIADYVCATHGFDRRQFT